MAIKVMATVAVFSFLSTLPASPVNRENLAHIAAGASPFGQQIRVNDNSANEQTVPVIVSLPGHALVAFWQDTRAGYGAIYTSRSLDNGTTWAPNKRVDDPIFNSSIPMSPAATVTTNGTVLVVWEDNRMNTFDYDIFLAVSYNKGLSFSKNVRVDDGPPGSWQEKPSVAVTGKGTVYVAWTDDRTGLLRVRGSYSLDKGSTFSSSKEIVPNGTGGETEVSLAVNFNTIYAAFMDNITRMTPHPFLCVSKDGGKTFTSPQRLDDTGRRGRAQYDLSIVAMPAGGVAAIWTDYRNGNPDIYVSVVAQDLSYAISNLRIEDDSTYLYAWQERPCIASDALGNIYAAWQDERTTGYPAIRFALLKVGKTSFNASVEVAKPGNTDMQMMPSVTAGDPGRAFVTWQDDKGGTDDVYTAAGSFTNVYGIVLTSGWNLISTFVNGSGYRASTLGLMRGDSVLGWNTTTSRFDQNYIVGISPPSADFPLHASTGYWVYATKAEALYLAGTMPTAKQTKKVDVPAGGNWVAIGFESFNSSRRASDIPALYNASGGISSVYSFDPSTGVYSTYIVGVPSTDFKIVLGRGYWIWCKVSGVLSYLP
jgi:hypothetical protein